MKLLKKDALDHEEKEAVKLAIGILSWTALAKNRIKAMKERREKKMKF